METKKPTKEMKTQMDVFMAQAAYYQKGLHEIVQAYREKGLDVAGMSIVHCGSTPGKTRVGRSILADPADVLSMLDDINKAFPGIIKMYVLKNKIEK
jgi:hypothetical protein